MLAAVERAGAEDVVTRLSAGLDTQLGPTWPDGVDLSFGQWQKLALARGFMRDAPLLLVLDEPTAALDAETEHALFERYAAVARRAGDAVNGAPQGRVIILVSHRFSTVRMADLIVVLDGARLVEVGTPRSVDGGSWPVLGALWHPGGGVSLSRDFGHHRGLEHAFDRGGVLRNQRRLIDAVDDATGVLVVTTRRRDVVFESFAGEQAMTHPD